MKHPFRVILIAALLTAALPAQFRIDLHAQPSSGTDADASLPWNRWEGFRDTVPFVTIVGVPGTSVISGSSISSPFDPTFPLTLPFEARLFDTLYPAGHTVQVGVAGFLSLNSMVSHGEAPYRLDPEGIYVRTLMPFWGEWGTTGGPGHGIHHRLDTLGSDTVWTIEWRVATTRAPYDAGAFQLRMVRHALTSTTISYADVSFLYDPTCMMAMRRVPGPFGAQAGIRNAGQPIGYPPPLAPKSDDAWYFLLSPGAFHPDQPAITRLATDMLPGGLYRPRWYATMEGPVPASRFHFGLPDSTFKMKPIDMDIGLVEVGPPVSKTGSRYSVVDRPATFGNVGTDHAYQVPVAVYIFDGPVLIDSTITTIDTILAGEEESILFTVPALAPGIYRAVAISRLAGDRNRSNDTMSRLFYVRPDVDVMPRDLIVPVLGPASRYLVDSSISVQAGVAGIGEESPAMIRHRFIVRNAAGSIVASVADSTPVLDLLPDSVRIITLGSWTPSVPGLYYVTVIASAEGDELSANDTLVSRPSADWRGTGPGAPAPPPLPLRVFPAYDLSVADPSLFPHVPFTDDTVAGSTPLRIIARNDGGLGAPGVVCHVVIRDSLGSVVYDSTSAMAVLPGGGSMVRLTLPAFTVPAAGRYVLRAWLGHGVADSITDNDTAEWSFHAVAGPKRALLSRRQGRLLLHPNPTTGIVHLDPARPAGERIRVIVTDLLGAEILRLDWSDVDASLRLDLRGHPAGIYLVRVEGADAVNVAPVVVGR